ncbi:MAG: hypothetical protein K9M98_08770 [Cephaloticoccus sp.]|nr:hypothetical protein [Cephaloticoccus sp.]MCF7760583.1 hypothetical protein [Cephaloticoccus sp.]
MTPKNTSPQVTLELLLRLKRAERPAPEFWQQFERDLRIKQLAAIVEPRPWWAPFIRVSARIARYQVPVGATAILALTFLTVRDYRLPEAVDAQFSPGVVMTKIDTMPGPAVAHTTPVNQTKTEIRVENSDASVAAANRDQPNSRRASQATMTPDQVSEMVPMLSGGAQVDESYSPAARMIAANLAAVKASAPELVQMMERVSGMDALLSPRTKPQVVDPLARVRAPSESRRSNRLLASALPAVSYAANDAGERVLTNRLDRTLTEERLYDSISRFGVKADRVAIKF